MKRDRGETLERYFEVLVNFGDDEDKLQLEGVVPFLPFKRQNRVIRRKQYNTLIGRLREAWPGSDHLLPVAKSQVWKDHPLICDDMGQVPAKSRPWHIAVQKCIFSKR